MPTKGEEVLAFGNPTGLKFVVSNGIVSAVQDVPELSPGPLVQFTAPVSPGSSGGPLVNSQGEVIGIVTLTRITGQNLNFAIPASSIFLLVDPASEPNITATLPQKTKPAPKRNEKPVIAIHVVGDPRLWKIDKASLVIEETIISKVRAADYYMEFDTVSFRRNLKEFLDGVVSPNRDVDLTSFEKNILIRFGKKYNYDYLLAINIDLYKETPSSSTEQKATITMTVKLVDVSADKYIYFDTIREEGKDYNFWMGGKIDNAVTDAVSKAMRIVDSQVVLPKIVTSNDYKLKVKGIDD